LEGFCGGRKTGEPGEKPSEQGAEPTTSSTHIHDTWLELKQGHIGGRRALSPLHHPCSPKREPNTKKEPSTKRMTFFSNQCIIKQLLEFVFVISRTIEVSEGLSLLVFIFD